MPTQDEEIARPLREALAPGELAAAKGFDKPLVRIASRLEALRVSGML